MEDKQLNLNQPLLSVRRFSSIVSSGKNDRRKADNSSPVTSPLPFYKSELKSGPVRNPGAVPFVWEQSPGRPKYENKPRYQAVEQPPIAPKLPPGRISKANLQDSDKVSEVPILCKAQARIGPYQLRNAPSLDDNVIELESFKDTMEEESSDSRDDDEAYQDALETLSRSNSFFLNCSESGISGLDGPDVKLFGTFSTDSQTRDFMMGRFLPAAKAMASETPQHAPRKQPLVQEQPRQVKKIFSGVKGPPLRYGTNIGPHYAEDNGEEESDDDYDEHEKLSYKVCGLLPRFCFKNSFFLLNPVPAMSVRTRLPMSPVTRSQARPSSGFSYETGDEATIYAPRSVGGVETTLQQGNKSILKNGSKQSQGHSHKLQGSYLHRHLQSSDMPLNCNESAQFLVNRQKEFLGIPEEEENARVNTFSSDIKSHTSFQELLSDQSCDGEIQSVGSMVEKTLYVDAVHRVESLKLNSGSSDSEGVSSSRKTDFDIITKSNEMEEPRCVDSSLKDIENLNIVYKGAELRPNAHKSAEFDLQSSAYKLDDELEVDKLKGVGQVQDLNRNSTASTNKEMPRNVGMEFDIQRHPQGEILEVSRQSHSEFPVPPPLPKSPSDSWLSRALPYLSSKNPSSQSLLGTRASKSSSVDPKWETIVKNTREQHHHLRFSEELTPIPENQ